MSESDKSSGRADVQDEEDEFVIEMAVLESSEGAKSVRSQHVSA